MDNFLIPVSPGEVLDKICILEIKSERMTDPQKLSNVRTELAMLKDSWEQSVVDDGTIVKLHAQLKEVNEALWVIEDDIRDKERSGQFDLQFIELARSVYFTNDKRSKIKKELNLYLGSDIVEEKSYQDY
jgi:hypothetical protein